MVLIAVLAYSLATQLDGINKVIPTLGALALGAQRLLPIFQQVYTAWAAITGEQASLQDTLELLSQPLLSYVDGVSAKPLPFNQNISFKQISYRYNPETPYVL